MGVSTDGILFYGIHFNEEWAPDNDDWFWKDPDLEDLQLDFDRHCSGDYPMFYIAVRESHLTAHRGYPQRITSPDVGIKTHPGWDERVLEFCKRKNIEPQSECGWWLVSLWG